MNITVDAREPREDSLELTLTIPSSEVDRAVKHAYREVSDRYTFQGFRRGRTPRPVIDAQIGRDAILADATNDLLNDAEPLVVTELDVVPVGHVDYGEDVKPVVEHEDYVVEAKVALTPTSALTSYEPVAIDMPPEEATEAEVESQVNLLLSYQTHFHEVEEERPVEDGDFVTVSIENVEGAERYEDESRLVHIGAGLYPEGLEGALVGMRVGDTQEVTFAMDAPEGEEGPEATARVTVKGIREQHVPELTDELAHDAFGFDTVEELRKGLAEEITKDKEQRLPELKESRVLAALTKRLERTEFPDAYIDAVYNDLLQQFVQNLQAQGISLDLYLQSRGATPQMLMADLRNQAREHAEQSVALDALAAERGIEVTEDDLREEMEKAGVEDIDAFYAAVSTDGRLPELRRSFKRSRALDWLMETAEVTTVDEVARAAEEVAEEVEDAGATVDEALEEAVGEAVADAIEEAEEAGE